MCAHLAELCGWCSRYSRTCLACTDHAGFWSNVQAESMSGKKQMTACSGEVFWVHAHHRSLHTACRSPSGADLYGCWPKDLVLAGSPVRKDVLHPSQWVHTGDHGRKVTQTFSLPWGQQHSNTVIPQVHLFSYTFVPLASTLERNRERCAQKVHRYQRRFEKVFSLPRLLPLLPARGWCQMSDEG